MRFRLRTLLIVLACAAIAVTAVVIAIVPARQATNVLAEFQTAARNVDSLRVYEGLPHDLYEGEDYERELGRPDIFQLHSYPFYTSPLDMSAEDKEALASILEKPTTWRPFSGEKKCGGFHPDYAVELTSRGVRSVSLLCFGCFEGKIFRSGSEGRYDMSLEPRQVLAKYRKNRPTTAYQPD